MPATAAAFAPQDYARRALARYWWRVARARSDFPEFAELVVKDSMGVSIRMHRAHLSWIWHLIYCWNRGLHAAIWAPWGSGKSSILTAFLSWLVGRDRQIRIKAVSNGDQLAGARVMGAKSIMETAEYRDVFPGIKPGARWNVKEAFVQRLGMSMDPTLHARGVNTPGTGTRADVILFDDVVDFDNSQEHLQRRKVKMAVHQKWMGRLVTGTGRVMWIATPWHVDDASYELLTLPNWCTLIQRIAMPLDGTTEEEVIGAGADYAQAVAAMQAEHERARDTLARL